MRLTALSEQVVVVLVLVCLRVVVWRAWPVEVLRTTAEEHLRSIPFGPAVVGSDSVQILLDDRRKLGAVSSVGNNASRRSISNEGSANNTDRTIVKATKSLSNGLELWRMKRVWVGVSLDTKRVDGRFVAGEKRSHGVCRVRDERINRFDILVSEDWERIDSLAASVRSMSRSREA